MITVPPAARAFSKLARVGPRPPVVEQRRLDFGHPSAVGIRFGGDVLPGVARRFDRRQKRVDVCVGRRIHVHDVEWNVRSCGSRERLLKTLHAAAHVNVR
jgi:hypothetical protein